MSSDGILQASLGVTAGSLIQVISGINFYLYARAARQFAAFHVCLERTNRFILNKGTHRGKRAYAACA
jgi:hypothetical protein